jgi:hypothetical protein
MSRFHGAGLAIGAAAALAVLGAWGSRGGSLAKGRPSEQEIQRGRVTREIRRIVERGPSRERDEDGRPVLEGDPVSIVQISEETGLDADVVESEARRLASPGGGRGYYLSGAETGGPGGLLSIGQVSPTMRWLTERAGKLKAKEPELAIRLVDVVIAHLGEQVPLGVMPSGVDQEVDVLEDDFRVAYQDGEIYKQVEFDPSSPLQGYASVYHEALKDRRILRTGKNPELWTDGAHTNFDKVSTGWRGFDYLPWIESVIRDAIERDGLDNIRYLLDRLTHVLDWVDAPGRREAIREARRIERRRADRQARRARGQELQPEPQGDAEGQAEAQAQARYEVEAYGPEELKPGVSLADAIQYADNWQQRAGRRASKEIVKALRARGMWFACPDGIHPIESPVVHRHANGFTWRKISTFEEKAYEGNMGSAEGLRAPPRNRTAFGFGCLRHCIGTNHINDYVEERGYVNYSLRTPANRPLLTITVRGDEVIDFAGRMNRSPGTLGSYGGGIGTYVMSMLQKEGLGFKNEQEYLDAEASMIQEFFKAMRLDLGRSRHTSSVISRLKEIEERKRAAQADGSANRWRSYSRSTLSGKMRDSSRSKRGRKR